MGDGIRFENGDYGLASSTLVPSAQNQQHSLLGISKFAADVARHRKATVL